MNVKRQHGKAESSFEVHGPIPGYVTNYVSVNIVGRGITVQDLLDFADLVRTENVPIDEIVVVSGRLHEPPEMYCSWRTDLEDV